MKRRTFLAGIGAACAWPLAASGQQAAVPVVGLIDANSSDAMSPPAAAFREGLRVSGFVEQRNVAFEYRFLAGRYDGLQDLAADLAHRQVAVIAAGGNAAALAAKSATSTIPIVFFVGLDPVKAGLVTGLSRPGANVTGVATLNTELGSKRLELLHQLLPDATVIPCLMNPTNPNAEMVLRDTQAAAANLGMELPILHASTEQDLESVFAALDRMHARGLLVAPDVFFNNRSPLIAALALQHGVPAIYEYREFAAAGGLMAYGDSITDLYHQVGLYTGRVLKGEKPGDLPVQQATKVELIINMKTAKTFGLNLPLSLLGRADEVIE
jgi:putative tryptophan/tyrosine transport system substrate-binding protein